LFRSITQRYASISIEGEVEWRIAAAVFKNATNCQWIDITSETHIFCRESNWSPLTNLKGGGTFLLKWHDMMIFVWSDFSRGSGGGTVSRIQICASGLESMNKVRLLNGLNVQPLSESFVYNQICQMLDRTRATVSWREMLVGLNITHPGKHKPKLHKLFVLFNM
jgi:hypothetical protein